MMVTMAAGRSFRLASAAAEEENGRLGLLGRLQIALHSTVGDPLEETEMLSNK